MFLRILARADVLCLQETHAIGFADYAALGTWIYVIMPSFSPLVPTSRPGGSPSWSRKTCWWTVTLPPRWLYSCTSHRTTWPRTFHRVSSPFSLWDVDLAPDCHWVIQLHRGAARTSVFYPGWFQRLLLSRRCAQRCHNASSWRSRSARQALWCLLWSSCWDHDRPDPEWQWWSHFSPGPGHHHLVAFLVRCHWCSGVNLGSTN